MPRTKLNGKCNEIALTIGRTKSVPKRERTRRQIIASAMSVFSARGIAQSSLKEIAVHAGVTVGTVYNHFSDRTEVVAAVSVWIIRELEQRALESRRVLPLGAERVANGCHRYLAIARKDPQRATLILELAVSAPDLLKTIGVIVLGDIRLGVRQKAFRIFGETAAVDLVTGCVMLGMRYIALGRMPATYERSIVATVLQGLGLSTKRALELARRSR
jgi:AcrR family transcriptional regulator